MPIYAFQDFFDLTMDMGRDLTNAATKEILYKKPSGVKGAFSADVVNVTSLFYQVTPGDLNEVGIWQFQGYVVIDGKTAFGDIIKINFEQPLN